MNAAPLSFLIVGIACTEKNVGIINSMPEAEITQNEEMSRLEGYPTTFFATFTDTNHQGLDLESNWFLNGESVCSESTVTESKESSCTLTLDSGDYTISVQVIDGAGASHKVSQSFSVTPTLPPTFEIEYPQSTQQLYSDQLITFSGFASDPEDMASELQVEWKSDNQEEFSLLSTPDNSGYVIGSGYLAQGAHLLTAVVTDRTGKTHTANTTVEIGPPNSIPSCAITSPSNEGVGAYSTLLSLSATAQDEDISSDQLLVEWHSDKDGLLGTSTPSTNSEILFSLNQLSVNTHTITLKVQDEVGATCSDFISYTVTTPPQVDILSPTSAQIINEDEIISFSGSIFDAEDAPNILDLSWTLDGVADVHTISADSDGSTNFSKSSLEPGEHHIVLSVEDSAGYNTQKEVYFYVNDLPSTPLTNISPMEPKTTDDITAQGSGSTDMEGDVIVYDYEWLKNGVATGITSSTISSSLTNKGEIWTVIATPSDSYGSGVPSQDSILIENTLPIVTSVSILPSASIFSNTTLHCSGVVSDPDETPTLSYTWMVQGVQVGSSSSITLDNTTVQPGDSLRCIALATDSDLGTATLETAVTIENLAPVIQHTVINGSPKIGYDVTCQSQSVDPDGGMVSNSYEWTHPALGVVSTEAYISLDTSDYAVGDTLTCTSTATDNDGDVAIDIQTVTIQNTEPEIGVVSITPSTEIYSGSTLDCHTTATDINEDPFSIAYSWSHNGQVVGSGAQYVVQNASRDDIITCAATATDIHGAASVESTDVLVSNHTPSYTSVQISPQSPKSTDSLLCTVQGSFDQDGDVITPNFTWQIDGAVQSETSNTLQGPFPVASTITCTAQAYDGLVHGNSVQTQETVINTAPAIQSVSLAPSVAYTNESIVASVVATDIDNQSLSHHFDWYVNGQMVQSSSTATLDGTIAFDRGDTVHTVVTSSDGALNSVPYTSSSITIQNTAPVVSSVLISDSIQTKQGDTMNCSAHGTDLDQDALAYHFNWYKNGTLVASGAQYVLVTAVHQDEIQCEATVHDGTDTSTSKYASFFVGNTAPMMQAVVLSPMNPKADDDITCAPQAVDVDGESLSYTYVWTVDGAVQSSTSNVLSAGTAHGSVVSCSVIPNDGTDSGAALAKSITIQNTAPVMSEIVFAQSTAYTSDVLTAIPSAHDLDNHSISFSFDWYVNGILVQSGAQNTLDGSIYFDKDDSIIVSSIPNDGIDAGASMSSDTFTISNTSPEKSVVSVNQDPTPNEDEIVCTVLSSYDLDGDALDFTFIWYQEGVEYTGALGTTEYANDTVPSHVFGSYETWTCAVISTDSSQEESTSDEQSTLSSCAAGSGYEPNCAAVSCHEIAADGMSIGDGTYWIDPTQSGTSFPAHCDMTTDGGGWTMCYTTDNEVHIETETTPTGTYGDNDYRTNCSDIPFSDIIVEQNDSGEVAWFSSISGQDFTLNEVGYRANADDFGTMFSGHGVAPQDVDYQVMVCDGNWMHTGITITGNFDSCTKTCSHWCQDNATNYYRANGDNKGKYEGVAFNENGHNNMSYKTISVGIR